METMQWMGLEQGSALDDMLSIPGASQGGATTSRVPPTLLGAMSAGQYYYDSLGQMVGMRSHAGISRFAYDGAGRLTGAHTPHAGSQRWQFDPAGNRLPIAGPDTKPTTPDAITGHLNETDRLRAQQRAAVQANPITKEQLLRSDFNPLQADPDPTHNQPLHTSKRWAGNRVAYYENQEDASSQGAKIHYQYDSRGNRTQSLDEATGRKLELMYDSGNQLVQVIVTDNEKQTAQQYRYDAFGRRLAKYSMPANSGSGDLSETDYFGWDGDRLIHTERFNSANLQDGDGAAQPEIIHTIYEPGSFTPLIQLRRATKAEPDLGEQLLANTSPGVVQDALRKALADIKELSATLPQNIAFKSMSKDVQIFMREQLQEYEQTLSDQRKEAAEKVEIRHYLCDHLGTPNALIREDSRLDWAVQLDPWGNVRAEHNPSDLYQPIRLPGQHHNEITGIDYNRCRYIDNLTGKYVSQDLIGLSGGFLKYSYANNNPLLTLDPLGLFDLPSLPRANEDSFLGYLWNQTIDGELFSAGMNCEDGIFKNAWNNARQSNNIANELVDGVIPVIPDILTNAKTPLALALGGAAARSYGGSTILQSAFLIFQEGRPLASGVMPIRTSWKHLAGKTVFTTGMTTGATAVGWYSGLGIGSLGKAVAYKLTCTC